MSSATHALTTGDNARPVVHSTKPAKRKGRAEDASTNNPFILLAFVRDRSKEEMRNDSTQAGRDFWVVKETGNYSLDCALGEGLADQCVRQMIKDRDTYLLGWAVRDMIAKGHFGGVEVGFLGRISEFARRGAGV